MNRCTRFFSTLSAIAAAAACGFGAVTPAHADANPFEEGAYLWNQAYDTDLNGPAGTGWGDWSAYKSWLGVSNLGIEVDPGWGTGDWYDCCQHVNWNSPWGTMQQRYGAAMPDVIVGMGQMPWDPNGNDSWNQKLAWENQEWQLEANNDPATMAYFANFAQEIDNGSNGFSAFNSVIIRLGYEFDGGWNPFGNLNVMSNMPNNYIKAWQNIVTTMRANDPKHIIKGFLWNPTDGNVQVNVFDYYPGDAYVDFVGFDEYDYCYNGDYPVGTAQPTQAQQTAAWNDVELPRINQFGNFSRAHGNKPIIIGEWGLWQLNDGSHPSGGDNPFYIQHMHDWMADPNNHVSMEVYFETPSDGDSQLWTGGHNPSWGATTAFPNSAALYRSLFGGGTVPAAPTWSSLTPYSGAISLSWYWTPGATSFTIYRGTTPGGESATPIASGDTSSNWYDNGLIHGQKYYYKLKAVNAAGSSAMSAEASATAQ